MIPRPDSRCGGGNQSCPPYRAWKITDSADLFLNRNGWFIGFSIHGPGGCATPSAYINRDQASKILDAIAQTKGTR